MAVAMNLVVPGNLSSKFVGRPMLKLVFFFFYLWGVSNRDVENTVLLSFIYHGQVASWSKCSWLPPAPSAGLDPFIWSTLGTLWIQIIFLGVSLTWIEVELRVWSITGKKQCLRPLTKLLLTVGQSGWSLGLQKTGDEVLGIQVEGTEDWIWLSTANVPRFGPTLWQYERQSICSPLLLCQQVIIQQPISPNSLWVKCCLVELPISWAESQES